MTLLWLAAREERTLDEHLLSIGRKTALERLAYLLWFLFDKARGVALVKANKLELPMSQLHLADTLGLSLVHTNKTLQKLREKGSITLDGRTMKMVDEEVLKDLGRIETVVPARRPLTTPKRSALASFYQASSKQVRTLETLSPPNISSLGLCYLSREEIMALAMEMTRNL